MLEKEYNFFVTTDSCYSNQFFSPLRKKTEVLRIILTFVRYASIYDQLNVPDSPSRVNLRISKNSRLTFISDAKCFSITFPFTCREIDGDLRFFSTSMGELSSILVTDLLSLIGREELVENSDIFTFADSVSDTGNPFVWSFLQEMLLAESGYMRCDTDHENENGHLHPLHHIDFFFSQKAKVKIGLNEQMDDECFIDIMNVDSDCYYLNRSE